MVSSSNSTRSFSGGQVDNGQGDDITVSHEIDIEHAAVESAESEDTNTSSETEDNMMSRDRGSQTQDNAVLQNAYVTSASGSASASCDEPPISTTGRRTGEGSAATDCVESCSEQGMENPANARDATMEPLGTTQQGTPDIELEEFHITPTQGASGSLKITGEPQNSSVEQVTAVDPPTDEPSQGPHEGQTSTPTGNATSSLSGEAAEDQAQRSNTPMTNNADGEAPNANQSPITNNENRESNSQTETNGSKVWSFIKAVLFQFYWVWPSAIMLCLIGIFPNHKRIWACVMLASILVRVIQALIQWQLGTVSDSWKLEYIVVGVFVSALGILVGLA